MVCGEVRGLYVKVLRSDQGERERDGGNCDEDRSYRSGSIIALSLVLYLTCRVRRCCEAGLCGMGLVLLWLDKGRGEVEKVQTEVGTCIHAFLVVGGAAIRISICLGWS